jgi:hypothetical protein
MKIFWSWQSDTLGKTGRHLVRDALKEAIERLKQATDVEEPGREELHLDQDIEGITGSPDLARTIFDKINNSDVVIADVTLVDSAKSLINSNVALELGYAFHAVTDSKVILVFNRYYGQHENLPFDLRHKGGAVVFDLAPDAGREEINTSKRLLTDRFVAAIRPLLQPNVRKETLSLRANVECRLIRKDGDDLQYMLTVGVENYGQLDATDFRLDLDVPMIFLDQSGSHRLQIPSPKPGYGRFQITNKDPSWNRDHLYPGDKTKNDLLFLVLGVRGETRHDHPELLLQTIEATVFSGNMKPGQTVKSIAELIELSP